MCGGICFANEEESFPRILIHFHRTLTALEIAVRKIFKNILNQRRATAEKPPPGYGRKYPPGRHSRHRARHRRRCGNGLIAQCGAPGANGIIFARDTVPAFRPQVFTLAEPPACEQCLAAAMPHTIDAIFASMPWFFPAVVFIFSVRIADLIRTSRNTAAPSGSNCPRRFHGQG